MSEDIVVLKCYRCYLDEEETNKLKLSDGEGSYAYFKLMDGRELYIRIDNLAKRIGYEKLNEILNTTIN